jgi:hypothetical protein
MSLIGPIVSSHRVELELVDVLQEWTHTYIGAAERENGFTAGTILRPASYRRTSGEVVSVDERLLPRIVLRSSAWGDPYDDGEAVSVRLAVAIAGFWKGRKSEETLDRIRVVEAAVRTLLLHKGASGPLIDAVVLVGGDYDVVDSDRENTLAAFELDLVVHVPDASRHGAGPTTADPPPTQPPDPPIDYPDRPDADTVQITTHHLDEE